MDAETACFVIRHGVGGQRQQRTDALVEDKILPAARVQLIAADAEQLRDTRRAKTGAVHDPAGCQRVRAGGDGVAALRAGDGCDGAAEKVLRTVFGRVFRQPDRELEGVENGRGRRPHGKVSCNGGRFFADEVAPDELQPRHAVFVAAGDHRFELRAVIRRKADHELARAPQRHVQLRRQRVKAAVARHAEFGHFGAGRVVEARVQHAGVAPGGPGAQIRRGLHHAYAHAAAAQLARHGIADHARADHQNIKSRVHAVCPPLP